MQRVLAGAAERVLDPPTRQRVAQRLEEAAAGLLEAGDEEGATAAVRTAEIVRDACAPLEVGYLRMLMELSCGLSRQQQRQEDEGKLILPGELGDSGVTRRAQAITLEFCKARKAAQRGAAERSARRRA